MKGMEIQRTVHSVQGIIICMTVPNLKGSLPTIYFKSINISLSLHSLLGLRFRMTVDMHLLVLVVFFRTKRYTGFNFVAQVP